MKNSSLSKISPNVIAILSLRIATAVLLARGMVVKHASVSKRIRVYQRHGNSVVSRRNGNRNGFLCAKETTITDNTIRKSVRSRKKQQRRQHKFLRECGENIVNGGDDCGGEEDDQFLSFEVNSFQELQRSTGSEILDDELQKQIDQTTPNDFLETHVTDASYMEKVAMSSVPEQLPQPAVNAFRQRRKQQQQTRRKSNGNVGHSRQRHGLEFPTNIQRVSRDEEIELANMIQRGVWLHKLKTDQETAKGRSINRNEWAKLAHLENTTQLRREVATYRRAKQLLVSANIGLVHAVVKKQYNDVRRRTGLTYEELVQEGSLGLLRAAELFDPSRGIRFSTYATIWIKGTLSNSHALDGTIKLPSREKDKWKKIVKTHQEIFKEKGGIGTTTGVYSDDLHEAAATVSVEEIANRLDMKVQDVISFQRRMKQSKKVLSLDYEYQQQTRGGNIATGGGSTLLEMDKNFQSDADLAERTQMQADVIAAMARNLTPREARLMRLRYGLTTDGRTRTIQECADAMGVSQPRASQLAKTCLQKLRDAAEADSLEEYLLTIA